MGTRAAGMMRRAFAVFITPRFQLSFNAVMAAVWAALFLPGLISWSESVPFLVICSIYANFVGHLSGIAGAVAARKADTGDPL